MPLFLTDEQRQALQVANGPLRMLDPASNAVYVLIDQDMFERLQASIGGDRLSDDERRVILQGVWQRANWDDPAMDDYAALDPRKKNP